MTNINNQSEQQKIIFPSINSIFSWWAPTVSLHNGEHVLCSLVLEHVERKEKINYLLYWSESSVCFKAHHRFLNWNICSYGSCRTRTALHFPSDYWHLVALQQQVECQEDASAAARRWHVLPSCAFRLHMSLQLWLDTSTVMKGYSSKSAVWSSYEQQKETLFCILLSAGNHWG